MRRLSGLDAAFLYFETPTMHMHVTGTVVLDPSTMPGGYSFGRIREVLASRLHLMPLFRERVAMVPFGLAHPVLIEDPDFDLDNHLHRVAVPAPGSFHELAEFVGDIASRPLDRSRPLWEMWVVEGLEHGYVALVAKMHHCAIDGVSGAESMVHIFDLSPTPEPVEPPPWSPEAVPSDWDLVTGALASRLRTPARVVRTVRNTARSVVGLTRTLRGPDVSNPTLPLTAPRTSFNGAVTAHRAVAFSKASLEEIKLVKNTFGTTVNDVVLAACTRSLRRWLLAHEGLPDRALVASVPVSVRSESDPTGGNRVSAMFVSLPVGEEDPVAALAAIREDTKGAKEIHGALGADTLQDWAEFAAPAVAARAARFYSANRLAERHPPLHNLIVSNVPGPPVPLYCAGARVVGVYPMGPILEGAGLNLTVLSNMGSVDFGAIACRELVPDLWDIATGFTDAVTEYHKAALDAG